MSIRFLLKKKKGKIYKTNVTILTMFSTILTMFRCTIHWDSQYCSFRILCNHYHSHFQDFFLIPNRKWYEVSFWRDDNVLQLIMVMPKQHCEYTKSH